MAKRLDFRSDIEEAVHALNFRHRLIYLLAEVWIYLVPAPFQSTLA
jgi:hypothetical protein